MLGENMNGAAAGFRFGYESPSQLSREHSRMFGTPPLRNLARVRTASQPESKSRPEDINVSL
jgi:hypothetical protein